METVQSHSESLCLQCGESMRDWTSELVASLLSLFTFVSDRCMKIGSGVVQKMRNRKSRNK